MEYLTVTQIATKLDINRSTVSRYIKRFDSFFSDIKITNRIKRYHPNAVEVIQDINTWHNDKGVDRDSIEKRLDEKYSDTSKAPADKGLCNCKDGEVSTSLFETIQTLNGRFHSLESKVDQIWNIVKALSSHIIPDTTNDKQVVLSGDEKDELPESIPAEVPGSSETDTMPDKQEEGPEPETVPESSVQEKKYDKEEICRIIVELKDNNNLTWSEIAQELKTMGYAPKDENKDTFHHLVVSNFYKYTKKHQLPEAADETGAGTMPDEKKVGSGTDKSVDYQESHLEAKTTEFVDTLPHSEETVDQSVAETMDTTEADGVSTAWDQAMDKSDVLATTAETPDWQDKEAYREYTLNLLTELKDGGMTLKKIVDKLYDMGIKTRSGKDKWSIGTVGNILKKEKK